MQILLLEGKTTLNDFRETTCYNVDKVVSILRKQTSVLSYQSSEVVL